MTCPGLPRALPADPFRNWTAWWGSAPEWIYPLENRARRRYGSTMHRIETSGRLIYRFDAVPVIARETPVAVRVEFHQFPAYETYTLHPMDYPRVFADLGASSPHRMPDDSLCLYYPADPIEQRWVAADGLDELVSITARHLFAEEYWRSARTWPLQEAPHGYRRAAA